MQGMHYQIRQRWRHHRYGQVGKGYGCYAPTSKRQSASWRDQYSQPSVDVVLDPHQERLARIPPPTRELPPTSADHQRVIDNFRVALSPVLLMGLSPDEMGLSPIDMGFNRWPSPLFSNTFYEEVEMFVEEEEEAWDLL